MDPRGFPRLRIITFSLSFTFLFKGTHLSKSHETPFPKYESPTLLAIHFSNSCVMTVDELNLVHFTYQQGGERSR